MKKNSHSQNSRESIPLTTLEKWKFRAGLLCLLSIFVALNIPHPASAGFLLLMICYRSGSEREGTEKYWAGIWCRWLLLGFRPFQSILMGIQPTMIALLGVIIFIGAMLVTFGGSIQGPIAPSRFFDGTVRNIGIYLSLFAVWLHRSHAQALPGVHLQTVKIALMTVMIAGLVFILSPNIVTHEPDSHLSERYGFVPRSETISRDHDYPDRSDHVESDADDRFAE